MYLTFRLFLDTAQIYANEEQAGIAIRESGLARNDIFVTTKYSGVGWLDIETSVQNSLKKVIDACVFVGSPGVLIAQHLSIVARPKLYRLVSYPSSRSRSPRYSNSLEEDGSAKGPGLGQVRARSRNVSSEPQYERFAGVSVSAILK